jgi:sec-independent protein translocase protein TatA
MNTILLFGMPGGGELFVIAAIVLLLFGGKKIPELMKGLGKGIREFNNAKNSIQSEINSEMKEIEKPVTEIKEKVKLGEENTKG